MAGRHVIGIVNHHFTLFLGAMLEASSAPACLQAFKDLHMLRMNRAPGGGALGWGGGWSRVVRSIHSFV